MHRYGPPVLDLSWRPVALACALVDAGADLVVVGGTARHLRGQPHCPRDLDVAVTELASLLTALSRFGVRADLRGVTRGVVRVDTALGPLDVFRGTALAGLLDVGPTSLRVAL